MIPTTFQQPEMRNSQDDIILEGAYGKNTAFCNGQNTGILDYINNNLLALYSSLGGMYSADEVDALLEDKADTDDVYTKSETDTALATKLSLSGGVVSGPGISFSSATDKGTPPASTQFRGVLFTVDQNGTGTANRYGGIQTTINTDGSVQQSLQAFKNTAGSSDNATLAARYNADGTTNYLAGGKEIDRVNSSGTNYVRYENGIQICWEYIGSLSIPASGNAPITYPQAFISTPTITVQGAYGTDWASVSSQAATGCNVSLYNASGTKYTNTTRTVSYIAVGRWK